MNLEILTDGSNEAKFLLPAIVDEVSEMEWPTLSPAERAPSVQISLDVPIKPGLKNDIWYCAHASIIAKTITDRLYIHDGTEYVKQTPAFVPNLEEA